MWLLGPLQLFQLLRLRRLLRRSGSACRGPSDGTGSITIVPAELSSHDDVRGRAAVQVDTTDEGAVHTVAVAYSRGGWTVRVPQVGVLARVPRLAAAESTARELVGRELGVPPETVRVILIPDAVGRYRPAPLTARRWWSLSPRTGPKRARFRRG